MESAKSRIRSSFMKLIEERSVDKITVKDIVADCGVNRNSFYYYYHDVPGLIEDILLSEADTIIEKYTGISSLEDCLTAIVDTAVAHKRMVRHIYYSADRHIYEQSLWNMCDRTVRSFVRTSLSGRGVPDSDIEILIHFYKCECFGQIIDWLDHGMFPDIIERYRRLCELKRSIAGADSSDMA